MGAELFLLLAACCLPLRHLRVNSGFGTRLHPVSGKYRFHAGVDLKARSDTVFAIAGGVVNAAGYNNRLGFYIRISHGELESIYGHLSLFGVNIGDSVAVAEPIGLTGATGQVTGEHLHFALSYQHHSIDPLAFLCGWYSYWAFRRYVTLCSVAKLTTCLLAKKCSLCFSSINKDNYLPISI